MAYIGYQPSYLATAPFAVNTFTGDGSTTTFTLSQAVPGANDAMVEVVVENVQQNPTDAYTIGGASNTSLIFSEAPISGAAIYVIHKGEGTYNLQPSTGSVTSTSLDPVLRNFTVDTFTGNGSTTSYTLTDTPYSANSIIVTVDGILQTATTNYSVSGTTLSFGTDAPASGAAITVLHLGFSTGNKSVADGTITPTKISSGGPYWTSGGNVGVGTTSPTQRLHVLNSTNTATSSDNCAVFVSSTNRTGYIQLDSIGDVNGNSSVVFSTAGTEVGRVLYNNLNNYMVFRTNGSNERMRIDSSGNVGVGTTTTTTARLNVTATGENVALFQNSNNSPALIRFREPATTTDPYIAAYGNAMAFGRYGSSETIRIDASGNVGIATNSPSTYGKLAVVGDGYFSGNLGIGVTPTNKLHISATVNTVYSTTSTLAGGVLAYLKNASTTDSTDATIRLEATGSSGQAAPISISAVNTGSGAAALTFATRASTATDPLERMRIDASGNVGIGQTTPTTKLHVIGSSNVGAAYILPQGALPDNNDNAGLYVLHQGTTGAAFRARTDNAITGTVFAHVLVNNASANVNSAFQVSHYGTGAIATFDKSGTVALKVNANGIGIGATTPSSGIGIAFPATQSASSDANTLDDYEEGTWTPAITPSTSGTITLKNITARYTKVGRLINVWFTAQVNTISSPLGRMGLSGLPFSTTGTPLGAVALINGFNTFTGSTGALIESSTTANIDRYNSGSIASDLASFAAVNGYIFFSATYDTSS
jgi:hypothetical protein